MGQTGNGPTWIRTRDQRIMSPSRQDAAKREKRELPASARIQRCAQTQRNVPPRGKPVRAPVRATKENGSCGQVSRGVALSTLPPDQMPAEPCSRPRSSPFHGSGFDQDQLVVLPPR